MELVALGGGLAGVPAAEVSFTRAALAALALASSLIVVPATVRPLLAALIIAFALIPVIHFEF